MSGEKAKMRREEAGMACRHGRCVCACSMAGRVTLAARWWWQVQRPDIGKTGNGERSGCPVRAGEEPILSGGACWRSGEVLV